MIYFIRYMVPYEKQEEFYFKIGFMDRDPSERIRELNKNSPIPIKEFLVIEGTFEEEQELHAAFRKYRYKGEYFCFTRLLAPIHPKHRERILKEIIDMVLPDRVVETCYIDENIKSYLYKNWACRPSKPTQDNYKELQNLKFVHDQYLGWAIQNGYAPCSYQEFKKVLLTKVKVGHRVIYAQDIVNMRLKEDAEIKRL